MNTISLRRSVRWGLLSTLGLCFAVPSMSGQRVALRMQPPVMPAAAADQGPLPQSAATTVTLYLQPTAARVAALGQYVTAVQTPGDPAYRLWLSPAEFGQKFGAGAEQIARVSAWGQANGLTVSVAASGLKVSVSGTVAQVESALAPGLHSAQIAGQVYAWNTRVPTVAANIANDVLAVSGLHTVPNAHPLTVASAAGTVVADDALLAVSTAVEANTSRVLSLSGTGCVEDVDAASLSAMRLVLQQASVQGMTVVATRGCGARGAASFPAMFSEVTGVAIAPGITVPADALLPEARPLWQTAPGLPADVFRHEPDLTTSDLAAFARTVSSIAASFPASADGTVARLGNINEVLYQMGPMKGLYTQPDSAAAGTWEAATGLGLVDLEKLAQFFPRGPLSDNVSVDLSPYYANHGATFTFTSTVTDTSGQGKGAVPTGTVTFTITGGASALTLGPIMLNSSGTAQTTTNQLPAGSLSVQATYSGDSNYAANKSITDTFTVAQEAASISGTQVATVPLGGTVTVLVTVKSPSGVGTPTGKATAAPQGTPDSNTYYGTLSGSGGTSTATVSFPAIQAGSIAVLVNCDGSDPNFSCYSPARITANITKATPAVALSYSPNPAQSGASETFTATVTAAGNGAAAPSGNVTFLNNGVTIGSGTLAGGVAQMTTVNFNYSASGNNFVASYDGDNNYNSNNSQASSAAGKIATTTVASANPTTVPVGGTVTFLATISPTTTSTAAMTGTVSFVAGSTTFCTGTVSAGSATCTAVLTAQGVSGVITATYSGDANYSGSASTNNLQVQVRKGDTAVALSASPTTPVVGQPTAFTATVTSTNGSSSAVPVTGQVGFWVNGTNVSSVAVNSSGQATYSTTLGSGAQAVYAVYTGDSNWNGSTSPTLSYTVGPNASGGSSNIVLTTNTGLAVAGSNIVLTATLTQPTGSTATSPLSGTVSFYDTFNGATTLLGTVGVYSAGPSQGVAQFSTTGLKQGTHVLYAVYSGNSSYASETSATHTVVLTDYSITFAPASLTLASGSSGSTTATIGALSGFAGTIKLACVPPSGVGITCSFNPATLTGAGTSTLTVITQAVHAVDNRPFMIRGVTGGIALAALLLGFVVPGRKRRMPVLLGLLFSVAVLGSLGCTNLKNASNTGTTTGTPAGTYNLTISSAGTDAGGTTVTHSQMFQVIVQ